MQANNVHMPHGSCADVPLRSVFIPQMLSIGWERYRNTDLLDSNEPADEALDDSSYRLDKRHRRSQTADH